MGGKNKVNQATRRQINKFVKDQFSILNEVIRPRPKYIPLFVWRLLARIFIDTDRLNDYLVNGVGAKDLKK